jgi:hypothetical protein
MALVHPKPENEVQRQLFKKLMENNLETPDTWEVRLSSGENKKKVFTDLISNKKLGSLALIRNLRNMENAGVLQSIVRKAISEADFSRIFPYQIVQAAQQAPVYSASLETAMIESLNKLPKLSGTTVIVIDVSGSMGAKLSSKSDMTRLSAGLALGSLIQARCEHARVFLTAGSDAHRIHKTKEFFERGFALCDLIGGNLHEKRQATTGYNVYAEMGGGGIFLVQAIDWIAQQLKSNPVDRVVVLTDEQDCDLHKKATTAAKLGNRDNYIVNLASAENGIAYGSGWHHINGFTSRVAEYLLIKEAQSK